MKLLYLIFSFCLFSLEGEAIQFSQDLKLKEKIKSTQPINQAMDDKSKTTNNIASITKNNTTNNIINNTTNNQFVNLNSRRSLLPSRKLPSSIKSFPSRKPVHKSNNHFQLSQKDYQNIRMLLELPLKNRLQALSKYGLSSFIVLKQFSFSNAEKMSIRWKAFTSLARLYPQRTYPLSYKALHSGHWFLRNAGLVTMEIINPAESIRYAGLLLDDPSLIVRTEAVLLIKKHKAYQYKKLLLAKLNASINFHKKQSLWIRHHIVSALAEFSEPGEEKIFISFLQDSDKRLHLPAIYALEKLTGKTFKVANNSSGSNELRQKWQTNKWISWWSGVSTKSESQQKEITKQL